MQACDTYLDFDDEERRTATVVGPVISTLLAILQSGTELPPETRRKLISNLLHSLSSTAPPSPNPASLSQVLLPIISLLKLLGRSPAGSEELGRERGLKTLLTYAGLSRIAQCSGKLPSSKDPLVPSESEALRCLCNTLMLHPSARELFPELVLEDPSWVEGMVRLLGVDGAGFLAGRLLFLLTSKQGEVIRNLAETGVVVETLKEYAQRYLDTLQSSFAHSLSSGPAPTPADTLREHVKMAYNLMLQYGRLAPLASIPASLSNDSPVVALCPPTPLGTTTFPLPRDDDDEETGYISDARTESSTSRNDGNSRPVSPALSIDDNSERTPSEKSRRRRFWESKNSSASSIKEGETTSRPASPSNSARRLVTRIKDAVTGTTPPPTPPKPILPAVPIPANADTGELTLQASQIFLPLFQPYLRLSCLLPLGPDAKDPSPLLRGTLNTLLNFPAQLEELALSQPSYSWLQEVPLSIQYYPILDSLPSRLLEILNKTCDAQFPIDVRPQGVKILPAHPDELIPKGTGESAKAEEILGPVMLLLRKLSMLSVPAEAMRKILLPEDMDRTELLERRSDLTGHLIRLLSSIMLPNTAYGVGEFLYNLCHRDPTILCQQIGYGNASGFLQNRGELIPPPPAPTMKGKGKASTSTPRSSPSTGAQIREINPITGAYEATNTSNPMDDMTQEEKERESERLYVLFDRMAKTGVMNVENPIEKARNEGRFVETSEDVEEERKRVKEEEEREEREVEEGLRRYKEKKGKPAARQ